MQDPVRSLHHAVALDPHFYVDSDTYKFEQDIILGSGWQVVAPVSLITDVGDIIARQVGGRPIFIVRSQGGALNGFYNICPHRAGPIATCDARGLKRLRCAYHGWAYDFDGQLTAAPEMKDADGFNTKAVRLSKIHVREWQGLVWVSLDP